MFKLVTAFFYVPDVLLAFGSIHQVLNPERFTDESRERRELNVFSCFLFADSQTNVGVACEQVLRGALAAGREKEGELPTKFLEFESYLQFPCGSSSTELSDFRQSARSGNERECKKKHWKTCAKGNDIITNVISANQHFASTFSMQKFKFQRRSCKLSFPFPAPPQERPGEVAPRLMEVRRYRSNPTS